MAVWPHTLPPACSRHGTLTQGTAREGREGEGREESERRGDGKRGQGEALDELFADTAFLCMCLTSTKALVMSAYCFSSIATPKLRINWIT